MKEERATGTKRKKLLIACLIAALVCVSCRQACFYPPKGRVIRQFYAHQGSFDTIAEFVSGYDKSGLGEPRPNRNYPDFWIGKSNGLGSTIKWPYEIEIRMNGIIKQIPVSDEILSQALHEVLSRQNYQYIDEPGFENQCIYFWARCLAYEMACGVVYTKDGEKIREAFGIPVTYTERLDDHWFYWEGDHSDGR